MKHGTWYGSHSIRRPETSRQNSGPAVVLSPIAYNAKVGLGIFCPVTRQVKGYPFEVVISSGLAVSGIALADRLKSLDWRARQAEMIGKLPTAVVNEIPSKARTLL